jgi:hypothetical protein
MIGVLFGVLSIPAIVITAVPVTSLGYVTLREAVVLAGLVGSSVALYAMRQ